MQSGVSIADLKASALFEGVRPDALEACRSRAQLRLFQRGSVLARQGDIADAFYILIDGSVEVVLERPGKSDKFVDVLARGDCIGDLALLLQQPRTATVRALRDSRTALITPEDFAWLLDTVPAFSTNLARTIGGRLQRTTRSLDRVRPVESIAVVPLSTAVAVKVFSDALQLSLARQPRIDGRPFTTPCIVPSPQINTLRDFDTVALLAVASERPPVERVIEILDLVAEFRPRSRVELVLLHRTAPPYRGTLRWMVDRRIDAWHHIEWVRDAHFDRLARRLSGRATSLVLSGGGARGLAHIGILRAFEEARIPIDMIAGASMGAIVAAQYAMGRSIDEIHQSMLASYVKSRGLPDLAIPIVALRSGLGTNRTLKAIFGKTRIEDLPVPFFSVSSDLSTAETVVHDTGLLWRAVRASCSVPGLLPPVRSRGALLVDGGLLDNLPVAAMRDRCSGRVAASDVSVAVEFKRRELLPNRRGIFSAWMPRIRMPGIGAILMRTAQLASVRDSRASGMPADLYLHPPVDDVGMGEFHRLNEIVTRGTEYAREKLVAWKP